MPVETQTEAGKKKLVDAVHEDLDEVTKHLTSAREIAGALIGAAKGLDKSLVTACTGWSKQLDELLHCIEEEGSAVERRMGGNGRPEIKENVDRAHVETVRAAREKVTEEAGA